MIQGRYQIWMLGHWNWKWETYAAPSPRSRLLFNPWRWSYRLLSTFNHIYAPCRYSTNSFPRHEWSVAARLLRGAGLSSFSASLCWNASRRCATACQRLAVWLFALLLQQHQRSFEMSSFVVANTEVCSQEVMTVACEVCVKCFSLFSVTFAHEMSSLNSEHYLRIYVKELILLRSSISPDALRRKWDCSWKFRRERVITPLLMCSSGTSNQLSWQQTHVVRIPAVRLQ